jgi:hypothetical protein
LKLLTRNTSGLVVNEAIKSWFSVRNHGTKPIETTAESRFEEGKEMDEGEGEGEKKQGWVEKA